MSPIVGYYVHGTLFNINRTRPNLHPKIMQIGYQEDGSVTVATHEYIGSIAQGRPRQGPWKFRPPAFMSASHLYDSRRWYVADGETDKVWAMFDRKSTMLIDHRYAKVYVSRDESALYCAGSDLDNICVYDLHALRTTITRNDHPGRLIGTRDRLMYFIDDSDTVSCFDTRQCQIDVLLGLSAHLMGATANFVDDSMAIVHDGYTTNVSAIDLRACADYHIVTPDAPADFYL